MKVQNLLAKFPIFYHCSSKLPTQEKIALCNRYSSFFMPTTQRSCMNNHDTKSIYIKATNLAFVIVQRCQATFRSYAFFWWGKISLNSVHRCSTDLFVTKYSASDITIVRWFTKFHKEFLMFSLFPQVLVDPSLVFSPQVKPLACWQPVVGTNSLICWSVINEVDIFVNDVIR